VNVPLQSWPPGRPALPPSRGPLTALPIRAHLYYNVQRQFKVEVRDLLQPL